MAQGPVFLERRSYRLRRMLDAIRLLPLLGLFLWMVPLLWPLGGAGDEVGTEPMPMSVALRYLFGIWLMLVFLGWALWRRTSGAVAALAEPHPDTPG